MLFSDLLALIEATRPRYYSSPPVKEKLKRAKAEDAMVNSRLMKGEDDEEDSGFTSAAQARADSGSSGSGSGVDPSTIYDFYKTFSSGSEAGAAEGAAEGAGTAVEGSEAGYMSGPYAAIAAVIAAQQLMSQNTDRRAGKDGKVSKSSGHRTGSVFSGDFWTEPWQAYLYDKMGIDKLTSGERFDAAIDKRNPSEAVAAAPGTAYQWFDPLGSTGYDIMSEKLGKPGKYLARAIIPTKWLTDVFADLF